MFTPIENVAALLLQIGADLLVPEPRVAAQQDRPARAGAANAGNEFLDEAQRAALGVGLPLALADVQHLAGVGAAGHQRVIAELAGVAIAGALLVMTMHLAHEGIDIDHQPLAPGPAPGGPRPLQAVARTWSSWRTCPNVKDRRNVPSVEGAIAR